MYDNVATEISAYRNSIGRCLVKILAFITKVFYYFLGRIQINLENRKGKLVYIDIIVSEKSEKHRITREIHIILNNEKIRIKYFFKKNYSVIPDLIPQQNSENQKGPSLISLMINLTVYCSSGFYKLKYVTFVFNDFFKSLLITVQSSKFNRCIFWFYLTRFWHLVIWLAITFDVKVAAFWRNSFSRKTSTAVTLMELNVLFL